MTIKQKIRIEAIGMKCIKGGKVATCAYCGAILENHDNDDRYCDSQCYDNAYDDNAYDMEVSE